jgi:hypothetical protein
MAPTRAGRLLSANLDFVVLGSGIKVRENSSSLWRNNRYLVVLACELAYCVERFEFHECDELNLGIVRTPQ